MVAERRIFFLGALPGGAGRRPQFLRPGVPRAGPAPPSYLDPKKRPKQFKINGLGVFLGTPLGRLWARTRFLDPPLVAQHGPSESVKKVVKPMDF